MANENMNPQSEPQKPVREETMPRQPSSESAANSRHPVKRERIAGSESSGASDPAKRSRPASAGQKPRNPQNRRPSERNQNNRNRSGQGQTNQQNAGHNNNGNRSKERASNRNKPGADTKRPVRQPADGAVKKNKTPAADKIRKPAPKASADEVVFGTVRNTSISGSAPKGYRTDLDFSDFKGNKRTPVVSSSGIKKATESDSMGEDFVDIFESPAPDEEVHFSASSKTANTRVIKKKKAAPPPPPPPSKSMKRKTKRVILSTLACLLALVMLVSGTGCIVMYSYLNTINYEAIDTETSTTTEISSVKPVKNVTNNTDAYEGKLMNDKQILNILLIGADTRKGQTVGLSDTMILFSIDTKHKKLKLLSFMRDTWVVVPGHGENKLNSAFTYGGAELTVKTIQANFGMQIDRYAIVDFKSFKNIIDKLGGIDIELTQEEVDYIDWQTWSNGQAKTRNELDAYSYTYKPNSKGEEVTTVHLNGRQALWHARNRGEEGICSGDDYVRTLRQRTVISILINKIKEADTSTLLDTLSEIGSMLTTNLKSSEILSLAQNISRYLKFPIVSQSAPDVKNYDTDYVYSDPYVNPVYVDGDWVAAILILNWQDFRSKIADFVFSDVNRLKSQEEQDAEAAQAAASAAQASEESKKTSKTSDTSTASDTAESSTDQTAESNPDSEVQQPEDTTGDQTGGDYQEY